MDDQEMPPDGGDDKCTPIVEKGNPAFKDANGHPLPYAEDANGNLIQCISAGDTFIVEGKYQGTCVKPTMHVPTFSAVLAGVPELGDAANSMPVPIDNTKPITSSCIQKAQPNSYTCDYKYIATAVDCPTSLTVTIWDSMGEKGQSNKLTIRKK